MVPFAFSLQDQVETYGVYVGFAAFLGLAVLTLLYFAQARELKRLRDWAGRAPERAQEIEARAVAQAEEALRTEPRTVGPARPIEQPTPAPAGAENGRKAGTPAPIPMGPRPATAAAALAQAGAAAAAWSGPQAPAAPDEAEAEEETPADGVTAGTPTTTEGPPATGDDKAPPPAGEDGAGDSSATGTAPAGADESSVPEAPAADSPPADAADPSAAPAPVGSPATGDESPAAPPEDAPRAPDRDGNGVPAARPDQIPPAQIPRATPRPAPRRVPAQAARVPSRSATIPPRRGAPAARRPAGADHGSAARMALIAVVAVLALAGAGFAATRIIGGGDEPAPPPNRPTDSTGAPATSGGSAGDRAAVARPETVVAVLNGTPTEGLASGTRDKLIAEGYSEEQGMIRTGNNTDQQRQDSVVLYRDGQRRQARDVASILDVDTPVEEIDPETQALADSTDETNSGRPSDVAVILGADQSP